MTQDVKLNAEDEAILNRLFGREVPPDLAEEMGFEAAKSVDMDPGLPPDDVTCAVSVLLSSIVHDGIGGGFAMGWTRGVREDGAYISVLRLRQEAAKAA